MRSRRIRTPSRHANPAVLIDALQDAVNTVREEQVEEDMDNHTIVCFVTPLGTGQPAIDVMPVNCSLPMTNLRYTTAFLTTTVDLDAVSKGLGDAARIVPLLEKLSKDLARLRKQSNPSEF